MKRLQATASVKATLNISVPTSTWGPECTIEQVQKQAKDEVKNTLRKLAGEHDLPVEIVDSMLVSITVREVTT